jgi:hypothetical protein
MFVHNVRYGFATNSSSTHSIVKINKGHKIRDNDFDQEFGHGFFTCASAKSKRQYLGQIVKHNLMGMCDLEDADVAIIASKWAGVEVDPFGYIDHQSIIALPTTVAWGSYSLRKDFFEDFKEFILRPDIAILGGNDNQESQHPLIKNGSVKNILHRGYWQDEEIGSPALNLILESNSKNLRARYDKPGKFWSLFCTSDGTKIRMSFTEDACVDKSEVPELVDIKITDYCKKSCSYCYQGSGKNGKHASNELVTNVAYALQELETFEVALGGGEPTEHPDLLEIIDSFHHMGIVVNLTTRNEQWIIDNLSNIKDKVGAIGLSVDSCDGLLDKLSKLRVNIQDANTDYGIKLTVQVVVGACGQYELERIFDTCKTFRLTVLLLGWKNTHRGASARKEEINLPKLLNKYWGKTIDSDAGDYAYWEGPSVSFDTTVVNQMKEWLETYGDKWTFTTREGAHSMYIDCVRGTMHRSSYDETPGESLASTDKYKPMSEHIQEYFSTI